MNADLLDHKTTPEASPPTWPLPFPLCQPTTHPPKNPPTPSNQHPTTLGHEPSNQGPAESAKRLNSFWLHTRPKFSQTPQEAPWPGWSVGGKCPASLLAWLVGWCSIEVRPMAWLVGWWQMLCLDGRWVAGCLGSWTIGWLVGCLVVMCVG